MAYGFSLFHKGGGRGPRNGVIGTWKDMPFKAADYWYYTESTDLEGNRSKSYSRFSVAVTDIEAWLLNLAIAKTYSRASRTSNSHHLRPRELLPLIGS